MHGFPFFLSYNTVNNLRNVPSIWAGEKPDMDHNPPIMNHNSRGRSTSSCNCGKKQATRDDPFDIKAANYDFYQVRMNQCA